jgi:acyl-coenzyme A synthetase/AMP-(fatty) acid ligase
VGRAGDDRDRIRSEIEADFAERLRAVAAFKRPARIHVFEHALPRTTTGKVRRQEILRILDGTR